MSIEALCPKCGRLIYAPKEAAGKRVVCPGCGEPVQAIEPAERTTSGEEAVELPCPNCAAPLRVTPRLVGLRVRCNTCRASLLVSLTLQPTEQADVARVAPEPPAHEATPDERDDLPRQPEPREELPKESGQSEPPEEPESPEESDDPLKASEPLKETPASPPAMPPSPTAPGETNVFRDLNIDRSLRQMVEGVDEPGPVSIEVTEPSEPGPRDDPAAPWFWPTVVAAAATGITLTLLTVVFML